MSDRRRYYRFLSGMLSSNPEVTPSQLVSETLSSSWDWERLIQMAAGEKILPALPGRLQELGVSSQLPGEITDFFDTVGELSLQRNRSIVAELAAVVALLNRIDIQPVLLKGAAYLHAGIYEDAAARYLLDIDLLIPVDEMKVAVKALRNGGYEEDASEPFTQPSHHHPSLRAGGAVVELHRELGVGDCSNILGADEMLSGSSPVEWCGVQVRLPSPDHMLVHHIMHSQVHHEYPERLWPSLRALYDLALLLKRFDGEFDWKMIAARFRGAGHYSTLVLHLKLAQQVLRVEFPHDFLQNATDSPALRIRWARRQCLRRFPALRWIDPIFVISASMLWRVRVIKHMVERPGGLIYLCQTPFRPSFYRHLGQEMRNLPDRYIANEDT